MTAEYCQRCQTRAAHVHVTEIDKDGAKASRHLCEECARDFGLPPAAAPTVLAVFKELMDKANTVARTKDRSCPQCGMTFGEFKAKARFGCAHDYDVFLARVIPLLQRIHDGASEHVGESDAAAAERDKSDEVANELRRLRRDLQRAIKAEEYEEAARLRDRIATLEKQLAEGQQLDG